MKKDNKTDNHEEIDLERRKAFKRLGLAASAVYATPVLMTLSQAHASSSTPSAPSVASAPSEPSVASAPSEPSTASTPSGPSTASTPSGPSTPSSSSAPDPDPIITR